MQCPECGTELLQGARYCHGCGWDSKLAAAGRASSTTYQRPAWKRWTMSVTLVIAALLVAWLLVLPRGDAGVNLVAGQAAPDFDLESLDGSRFRLSELKGRPVVINFWATWCTPCRKEMPEFEEMHRQFAEAGLVVLGINVGESKVAVADFQQQLGVTFPLLLDHKDQAQDAYRILPLPATFFVDRTGTIRAIYQYQMSRGQIENEVLGLLQR